LVVFYRFNNGHTLETSEVLLTKICVIDIDAGYTYSGAIWKVKRRTLKVFTSHLKKVFCPNIFVGGKI